MDNSKQIKATSYKDLIKTFQQVKSNPQTFREKKTPSTLQLKKQKINKQNIQTPHHKSTHQKISPHNYSQWNQEVVLKQHNYKHKDRQYQLSYNKFINYITNLMANLTGYIPPDLLHKKLTYINYLAAMKDIKFIKQTYQPSDNDLISQLWNQFNNAQQNIGMFIIIISAILNIKKNNDDYYEKYQHLWKKYQQLRYTRMQLLGKTKQLQKQQYSFSPLISQRSRTLATSRSKSKDFYEKHHKKTYQKSVSLLQQSEQMIKNIENRSSLKQFSQDKQTGNKRSQILYKQAKQKSLQKRMDKKSTDVQYQKSIKQLTFKPKIHANNKQIIQKKFIQGQQDSIDRMIKGRIERQVKKIIIQKGLPYNQKMFQRMKKQRYQAIKKNQPNSIHLKFQEFQDRKQYENQKPVQMPYHEMTKSQPKGKFPLILSIQVDQGVVKQLIINQGQNYKQVAQNFIKQLKLSQQMYDKLIIGIQNALKNQLAQIDEDSFESQYQSIC